MSFFKGFYDFYDFYGFNDLTILRIDQLTAWLWA
jgi:hypothetical protein